MAKIDDTCSITKGIPLDIQLRDHSPEEVNNKQYKFFTDGSFLDSQRDSQGAAKAGYGFYWMQSSGHGVGISKRVPISPQGLCLPMTFEIRGSEIVIDNVEPSALSMELYALLHCLIAVDMFVKTDPCVEDVHVFSDSLFALQLLFQCQENPALVTNHPLLNILTKILQVARGICMNGVDVHVCKVKGHSDIEGNNVADRLAKRSWNVPSEGAFAVRWVPQHSKPGCQVYKYEEWGTVC